MSKGQVPTEPVSFRWIMSDPAFERAVRDVRTGRPLPIDFDTWETDPAWNYERGRVWTSRVPASVVLKHDGRVTDEAVQWFMRVAEDIL